MKLLEIRVCFLIIFCVCTKTSDSRSSLIEPQSGGIRSDVIVTKFKMQTPNQSQEDLSESAQQEPGWLRRQLLRFGELTGVVGNKLGGFTSRLANALDKICEVVKTIIPVIAAVCHVGQFKFCEPINEAPQELAEALSPNNLDLSIPD